MRLRFAVALLTLILAFAPGANSRRCLNAQPPDPGEYSAADHNVAEFRDQRAPMRDGVRLAIDVFRPQGDGPFPVVLCMTPYNRNCQAGTGQPGRARWLAARGYAAVIADVRGRFQSEGAWDPFNRKHKTDGYDLVQWLARQPWSNGKVGSWGVSYQGWMQWWTATQAPPALVTIVPEVAPPDQFRNLPYQDGILNGFMMDWGCGMEGSGENGKGPMGGFPATRYDDMMRTPYIDLPNRRKVESIPWFDTWIRENLSTSDYWKGISYQGKENYEKIKAPSLAVSGWFDCVFPGTPMNYLGMKRYGGAPEARRPRIVIGPWAHTGRGRRLLRFDYGPTAAVDWDGYVCRWFDYTSRGHILRFFERLKTQCEQ
jgi:putative CocE/NonD family hydrolase